MKGISLQNRSRRRHGFALIELILILIVLTLLASLWSPMHRRLREKNFITIDQSNIRQILRGSALYNADNNDHMAHPTWGSDLTGPDGWAYLTTKGNREIPGATMNVPGSCAGRDVDTPQFTNQLAYFKVGQVSQYLPDVKTAWCPKDVATRRSSTSLRQLWLGRSMKVTSYTWNATIAGLVGRTGQNVPNGKTYKVTQFLPTDWQMWEKDETVVFNFNDAASHPEVAGELFSRRHLGSNGRGGSLISRNTSGGIMVGTFGGNAQLVQWPKAVDLMTKRIPPPNEILNGPGYRY
ncbi:MAG: hypothetical protein ACXW3Z_04890 [Limisphaerales bacterium]